MTCPSLDPYPGLSGSKLQTISLYQNNNWRISILKFSQRVWEVSFSISKFQALGIWLLACIHYRKILWWSFGIYYTVITQFTYMKLIMFSFKIDKFCNGLIWVWEMEVRKILLYSALRNCCGSIYQVGVIKAPIWQTWFKVEGGSPLGLRRLQSYILHFLFCFLFFSENESFIIMKCLWMPLENHIILTHILYIYIISSLNVEL